MSFRSVQRRVGGETNAALIHAKAQQVHAAVLNITTSYLLASNAPGVGVHSPAQIVDPAPNVPPDPGDVIAYPALEKLFGEMDYCACEHCRSILSPAAIWSICCSSWIATMSVGGNSSTSGRRTTGTRPTRSRPGRMERRRTAS